MAEYILMTALSPTMEEGTIASWSIKEKDAISSGDVICEVETDKATMDYESAQEGTLLKILVDAGANARVGMPIGIIGDTSDDIAALIAEAQQQTATDTTQHQADNAEQLIAQRQQSVNTLTESGADEPVNDMQSNSSSSAHESPPAVAGDRVPSSPLARKVAIDNGLEIGSIPGSGPKGRVVLKDVKRVIEALASAQSSHQPSYQGTSPAQMEDIAIPVSGTRKVIAKRLTESKFSAPHFYLTVSIDMQTILDARTALNQQRGKQAKSKISLNAYLMKIVAEALARNPAVNATWRGDTILQYASVDIGLAVDGKAGLITPIVKNCDAKGLIDIDSELQSLIQHAQAGTLKPEQYSNATFTISNLGSFGIENFTAIINPPGSAILAIGKTMPTPIVDKSGAIVVKNIMKVTLSCDHRVVDGAQAARFLSSFKSIAEDPIQLLY